MGFLSNLFGLKTKYVDEETDEAELAAEAEKRKAFFLEPDDAKTFGNIEYMRSPIQKKSGKKEEIPEPIQQKAFQQVMDSDKQMDATPEPQPSTQNSPANSEKRRADSSMDMFRKMAREIKKS